MEFQKLILELVALTAVVFVLCAETQFYRTAGLLFVYAWVALYLVGGLGLDFTGIVFVIVYVGAVAVLLVFVTLAAASTPVKKTTESAGYLQNMSSQFFLIALCAVLHQISSELWAYLRRMYPLVSVQEQVSSELISIYNVFYGQGLFLISVVGLSLLAGLLTLVMTYAPSDKKLRDSKKE